MDNQQLSEIFKSEYSNLVAVLCHYYGVKDIQLAQDIVSDTFVKAMKSWSHKGIPSNPKAWLRKVAQNQLNDHFRKRKTYTEKIVPQLSEKDESLNPSLITDEIIEDSQLRMIFVVCDPDLNKEAQISLALRILCGFNIEEIAKALLTNKENINKKLYRAKKAIKENEQLNTILKEEDYSTRLDDVLKVIYLLFNEGYYSSVKEENIREDICWEAMRLIIFLTRQKHLRKHKIHALLALMCFHVSRLDARKSGENGDLLYHKQDRSKWNIELVDKGRKYLKLAGDEGVVSKYFYEASIAYWHTVDHKEKWDRILQLYNRLLTIEYSPIIALNRTYALAKANSVDEAITEALKFNLKGSQHYFCLLAELYRMNKNHTVELKYLNEALACSNKLNEKAMILEKIDLVKNKI